MESDDDFETVFKRALAREKLIEMCWDLFVRYEFSKLASHEMSVQEYEFHVNQMKIKEEKERGI